MKNVARQLAFALISLVLLAGTGESDTRRLPSQIFVSGMSAGALGSDRFFILGGSAASTTENQTQTPIYANGIFKELRCRANAVLASDESWTLSLRVNGVTTALTCTIGNSARTCTDLLNTVPVVSMDLVNLLGDNTAGAAPAATFHCTLIEYEYQ